MIKALYPIYISKYQFSLKKVEGQEIERKALKLNMICAKGPPY